MLLSALAVVAAPAVAVWMRLGGSWFLFALSRRHSSVLYVRINKLEPDKFRQK